MKQYSLAASPKFIYRRKSDGTVFTAIPCFSLRPFQLSLNLQATCEIKSVFHSFRSLFPVKIIHDEKFSTSDEAISLR